MVMPEQPPTEAPFWKGTAAVRKRSARKQHSFSPPMLSWVSQLVLSTLRSLLKNNPKPQLIKEHMKGAWCRQGHASKGRSQCCGMWGRAAVGTGGQRRGSRSALACFGFCRKKKKFRTEHRQNTKGLQARASEMIARKPICKAVSSYLYDCTARTNLRPFKLGS